MISVMLAWGAWQAAGAPASAPSRDSIAFAAPELVCTIDDERLDEISGVVASRANPGLYYTHNDSGGKAAVYAIDRDGRIRMEIALDDAKNVDWEDIALAPGNTAGTFEICVADIGDNNAKRSELHIYRAAEPHLDAAADRAKPVRMTVAPTRYTLRYADGPRNAEALVVHPRSGDGYIITKRMDGVAEVYRIPAPWPKDRTIEMQRFGTLTFPQVAPIQAIVTGADLSPDGTQLVVRSYPCGWLWTIPPDAASVDFAALVRQMPVRIELAAEPQGEAICFSSDGRCLLTISEKSPTRLFESCRPQR
jgi:hypothetical protein